MRNAIGGGKGVKVGAKEAARTLAGFYRRHARLMSADRRIPTLRFGIHAPLTATGLYCSADGGFCVSRARDGAFLPNSPTVCPLSVPLAPCRRPRLSPRGFPCRRVRVSPPSAFENPAFASPPPSISLRRLPFRVLHLPLSAYAVLLSRDFMTDSALRRRGRPLWFPPTSARSISRRRRRL